MTIAGFIAKNALRNKRRALLSILSVAVSLFLFVTLVTLLRELTQPPEDLGASLRIAVRSKVSIADVLPARQLPLIEKIPGVECVTPFTWFGGQIKDDTSVGFAQFGIDPTKMTKLFGEAKLPQDQMDAWLADRTTTIVGKESAERYKWKIGDKVTLLSTIFPCDLEVKIVGIYSGTLDDRNMFLHQKYIDEALGDWGKVGMWWVRASSAEMAPKVIEEINKTFANSANEVRAESERAFQMGFVSMWGNIKILIGSICAVVVFTLLLVTASTMSMAIRERFRELAVLKAIGFRRRELFAFILAESFGLSMIGALVGAGGAWALTHSLNISKLTGGFFPYFDVSPRILGMAFAVASLIGIVASLAPSISVARTSVVEGLKTLD
ncbi:MAG: FtsX-like permease family protein [Chthoniobacteraceae bacterium]